MHIPALSIVASLLALPSLLFAQELNKEEAEQHLIRGNTLLGEGKYEEARRHFAVAQSMFPEASGPYAGLGFALQGLGDCAGAMPNFSSYLKLAPGGSLVKEVKAAMELCKSADAKLFVKTEPEGAVVTVDPPGGGAGQTPQKLSLKPGTHVIRLTKKGYAPVELLVELEAGRSYELPLVKLSEPRKEPKDNKPSKAPSPSMPVQFSLLLVPTTGQLAFADVLGFKISNTISAGTPLVSGPWTLKLGGGAELGLFKENNFAEPTLRLGSHARLERPMGKSGVVRLGLDGDLGILFHVNSFINGDGVRQTRLELNSVLRLAPTMRFKLSGPHSLVFQPIAITVDPTEPEDLFNELRLFEVFSFGYEKTL